jgi:hypothetical protein
MPASTAYQQNVIKGNAKGNEKWNLLLGNQERIEMRF